MSIKVSISPSQQAENPCVLGDSEQTHMFVIGQHLYNYFKSDNRFTPFITTKLPPQPQNSYLVKCVQETESFQGNEGIRISLHSDGGYKGSGVSCFYFSETSPGCKLAKSVYKQLCALTPWSDMSCYARPGLYEIKKPNCPAILVEVSFHDQKSQATFIHEQAQVIAYNIYIGVLNNYGYSIQSPILQTPTPQPQPVNKKWDEIIKTDTLSPIIWTEIVKALKSIGEGKIEGIAKLIEYRDTLKFIPDFIEKIDNSDAKWQQAIKVKTSNPDVWTMISQALINIGNNNIDGITVLLQNKKSLIYITDFIEKLDK